MVGMTEELSILETISRILPDPSVITDDAFYDLATRMIYTTDMLVEDRHFSRDYFSPADLGWKAAAVNVSDIAAMGGRPRYLMISLGLPTADVFSLEDVAALYHSLQSFSEAYGIRIIGGDTVGASQVILNITAIGELPEEHTLGRRSQAIAGDIILLTGWPGLSDVGLKILQRNIAGFRASKQAHLRPVPEVTAGLMLSKHFSRYSLIDTSDGLADALLRIAHASQVTMRIEAAKIPIHEELTQYVRLVDGDLETQPLETALYGGEDYGLLATIPAEEVDSEILKLFRPIGRVCSGKPEAWLEKPDANHPDKSAMEMLCFEKTYQHFDIKPI